MPWGEGKFFKDYSRLFVKEGARGRKEVLRIASDLANQDKPVTWVLPAYKYGDSKMLLDGCHRASALYVASIPFTLLLCTVHGPQDERGLWDFAA